VKNMKGLIVIGTSFLSVDKPKLKRKRGSVLSEKKKVPTDKDSRWSHKRRRKNNTPARFA